MNAQVQIFHGILLVLTKKRLQIVILKDIQRMFLVKNGKRQSLFSRVLKNFIQIHRFLGRYSITVIPMLEKNHIKSILILKMLSRH